MWEVLDYYSKEYGEAFLQNTHVKEKTLIAYACAIRRLDDYLAGKPYRCHHGNQVDSVTETYSSVLDDYLNECRQNGNATYTVYSKQTACTAFLNHIEQAGCSALAELTAGLVSQALLIYKNKDNCTKSLTRWLSLLPLCSNYLTFAKKGSFCRAPMVSYERVQKKESGCRSV